MKKLTLSILSFALLGSSFAQEKINTDFNCFSVVVGKEASADGSVLFAHNEDDGGEQFLNWYIVERETHQPGDKFSFYRGGSTEQPTTTFKYIWLELPKMEMSDSFLNENGVAVGSDGCPSREDREDYTDGGVLFEVRRIVAERATSARHGVQVLGELVEKYGYADSGRSYIIADKDEAWMVAVVKGRHWVAVRIPDNHIAAIPNTYTIDKVNLKDKKNCVGSADLIDYAIERGWYNPEKDGEFSFKKAYSNPGSYTHPDNTKREWAALYKLTDKKFDIHEDALPFSVEPKASKISLEDLFETLSFHYEGTPIDGREEGNKGHVGGICHDGTQYGAVFQLRGGLPAEIGSIMWLAPYHPCSKVYIPWYSGMTKIPEGLSRFSSYKEGLDKHMTDIKDFRKNCPNHLYWNYVDHTDGISADYPTRIVPVAQKKEKLQKEVLDNQSKFEAALLKTHKKDKSKAAEMMNEYTAEWVKKSLF